MHPILQFGLILGGQAAGPGPGPTGPPTSPATSTWDSPNIKWRVDWTVGDPAAYTRVYEAALNDPFGSATLHAVENPGVTFTRTTLDATITILSPLHRTFYLTHYRNGQESAPVAVNTDGSDP